MGRKGAVHDPENFYACHGLDCPYDRLLVFLIAGVHGDVPDDLALLHADDVHRTQVASGTANGHGDLGEHADTVFDLYSDHDAVAGTGIAYMDHVASPLA